MGKNQSVWQQGANRVYPTSIGLRLQVSQPSRCMVGSRKYRITIEKYFKVKVFKFSTPFSIWRKYSWQTSSTILCTLPMWIISWPLTAGSHSISNSPRNFVDTSMSASSGHGRTQSIVHSLKRDGNFYARSLNLLPTGEKARTMWRWSLTLPMK